MTLANNLLAVLEANASSSSSSSAGEIDTISTYKNAILANAAALDDFYGQSTADGISALARTSLACKAALLIFGSKAITPQSSSYTAEEQENWSANCWLPAACFIKVQNSLEVALALRIVTTLQATFTVRSAGHNPNPGFSSVGQQGILLDLGAVNQITVNHDKSVASVGPGSTWDAVYGALGEFDLTVVGGRSAGVGVGGLLLGGGMSHFSNFWGLACDNVVNYEVVLANSTIIQVNANENADLFKALKGGGPNFGIVTRFDLRTFPGSQLWYQVVVYNTSDTAAVMAATVEVQEAILLDDRIGIFVSDTPGSITAGMLYRGSESPPGGAFEAFEGIAPLVVAIPPTIGTFQACAVALSLAGGERWQIGALTVAMDASLYVELHDILAAVPNNASIALTYTYQPFSAQGVAQGLAHGGNSLNIAPENQAWLAFSASWKDSALNDTAATLTTQLMAAVSTAAAEKGKLMDLVFMNDSHSLQTPIASYGAASVAFLRACSKEYDPEGVFQRLQNSGFLLVGV